MTSFSTSAFLSRPSRSVMRPPSAHVHSRSRAEATGCRAVCLCTRDAHGLYSRFGFLPADETVMQRPRPVIEL